MEERRPLVATEISITSAARWAVNRQTNSPQRVELQAAVAAAGKAVLVA